MESRILVLYKEKCVDNKRKKDVVIIMAIIALIIAMIVFFYIKGEAINLLESI